MLCASPLYHFDTILNFIYLISNELRINDKLDLQPQKKGEGLLRIPQNRKGIIFPARKPSVRARSQQVQPAEHFQALRR